MPSKSNPSNPILLRAIALLLWLGGMGIPDPRLMDQAFLERASSRAKSGARDVAIGLLVLAVVGLLATSFLFALVASLAALFCFVMGRVTREGFAVAAPALGAAQLCPSDLCAFAPWPAVPGFVSRLLQVFPPPPRFAPIR